MMHNQLKQFLCPNTHGFTHTGVYTNTQTCKNGSTLVASLKTNIKHIHLYVPLYNEVFRIFKMAANSRWPPKFKST